MEQKIVYVYIFDGLADWEAAYALAGINSPALPAAAGRYRVQSVGRTHDAVTTMGGMRLLPDIVLEQLDPAKGALLILPGGTPWDAGELGEIMPYVARFREAGIPIAAICGATAGLARAGFLDTVRHTSSAAVYLQATGYQGASRYNEAGAVTDGGFITAGATGALEFAAAIFKQLELYPTAVTETWYEFFKTGDPAHFARLVALAAAESGDQHD